MVFKNDEMRGHIRQYSWQRGNAGVSRDISAPRRKNNGPFTYGPRLCPRTELLMYAQHDQRGVEMEMCTYTRRASPRGRVDETGADRAYTQNNTAAISIDWTKKNDKQNSEQHTIRAQSIHSFCGLTAIAEMCRDMRWRVN